MYFHLYITDSCNLACQYCRGKIFDTPELVRENITIDESIPAEISWELDDLYTFLSSDPDPVVTFIGGEPTLRCDLICRIMNEAPVSRYMIQTNGTFLYQLPPEIVNRFETILISIDGDQKITDRGRGEGTYQKVIKNIHHILSGGYQNELIARMTVTEQTSIRDAVLYLAHNPDHSFSSIHWQIDANFWNDYSTRSFEKWTRESYIPGLHQLARDWLNIIKHNKKVPKWYPFIDPTEDILLGRASRLRCGSGYANYSILTDGNIAPCPIMVGMKDYYAGSVFNSKADSLLVIPVRGKCKDCDIFNFCGGRCLYSSIMEPWPKEGADVVCQTVRALHDAIIGIVPEIQELISSKELTIEDFAHEKFNGCEIIP
ncbi:MAG: TIGR04084 family radical SAM/SPASM domain-containing protein [Methanomicrobiales archaeon]|nr:TIGR04084 family radical SAM/SPASM domain-containing protein [Methanomicrobiales archaeon]